MTAVSANAGTGFKAPEWVWQMVRLWTHSTPRQDCVVSRKVASAWFSRVARHRKLESGKPTKSVNSAGTAILEKASTAQTIVAGSRVHYLPIVRVIGFGRARVLVLAIDLT